MSEDWVRDINGMHRYYGVNEKVQDFDADKPVPYTYLTSPTNRKC